MPSIKKIKEVKTFLSFVNNHKTKRDYVFILETEETMWDAEVRYYLKKEDNLLIVDAAYRIDELEKDFNINLTVADEEEIETVGGLVFSKINRIPKSNEEFNIDDIINIKILRANERKILTVHITKIVS